MILSLIVMFFVVVVLLVLLWLMMNVIGGKLVFGLSVVSCMNIVCSWLWVVGSIGRYWCVLVKFGVDFLIVLVNCCVELMCVCMKVCKLVELGLR